MPVAIFLAVYAEPIVRIALGERWIGATPLFQILAIAALLRPAATTVGNVVLTCGHSRRLFWLGLITSITLLLCFVAGIPWGPAAIAFGHVWSIYLLLIPKLYWSFKKTPISVGLFFSSIARPLSAALVMGVILTFLRQARPIESTVGDLCLGVVVAILIYFALWIVMPGGRSALAELIADFSGSINVTGLFRKNRTRGLA